MQHDRVGEVAGVRAFDDGGLETLRCFLGVAPIDANARNHAWFYKTIPYVSVPCGALRVVVGTQTAVKDLVGLASVCPNGCPVGNYGSLSVCVLDGVSAQIHFFRHGSRPGIRVELVVDAVVETAFAVLLCGHKVTHKLAAILDLERPQRTILEILPSRNLHLRIVLRKVVGVRRPQRRTVDYDCFSALDLQTLPHRIGANAWTMSRSPVPVPKLSGSAIEDPASGDTLPHGEQVEVCRSLQADVGNDARIVRDHAACIEIGALRYVDRIQNAVIVVRQGRSGERRHCQHSHNDTFHGCLSFRLVSVLVDSVQRRFVRRE